jgi:hypothetical protein
MALGLARGSRLQSAPAPVPGAVGHARDHAGGSATREVHRLARRVELVDMAVVCVAGAARGSGGGCGLAAGGRAVAATHERDAAAEREHDQSEHGSGSDAGDAPLDAAVGGG